MTKGILGNAFHIGCSQQGEHLIPNKNIGTSKIINSFAQEFYMLLTFMDVCDNFDQVEKSLAYKRLHISFLLDGDCAVIRKCFIFLNFFPI